MKWDAVWVGLLLLTVTDLSFGRTVPNRRVHERGGDLLDSVPKGLTDPHSPSSSLSQSNPNTRKRYQWYGRIWPVGRYQIPWKAVEPIEAPRPDGPGSETSPTNPPPNEAGGSEGGQGQEAPNTESAGDEAGPSKAAPEAAPPATLPATPAARVEAPLPDGLGTDEMKLWNDLTNNPLNIRANEELILWSGNTAQKELPAFVAFMTARNPGVVFRDSRRTPEWMQPLEDYRGAPNSKTWMKGSIFSIKYAELMANHPGTVHTLYSVADKNDLPDDSLLTLAELPLVTAPESQVSQIYRWDVPTYQQAIANGDSPNVIWTPDRGQLVPPLTDLSRDPRAVDNPSEPDAQQPAPVQQPGPAPGSDAGSDTPSGCLSCIGLPNCSCT